MLKRVEDGLGCSVKDSFVVLDLEPLGSHVLFEATWVRRAAAGAGSASTLDWPGMQTPADPNSGPRVMDSMSSYLLCWTVTIFGSMALDRLMVPALRLIAAAAWSASPTCSPARLTWSRSGLI